jgi:hypothetical protein
MLLFNTQTISLILLQDLILLLNRFKLKYGLQTSVTVKLEGTGSTEKTVKTTKTSAWEELTFDFTAAVINSIRLYFSLILELTHRVYLYR